LNNVKETREMEFPAGLKYTKDHEWAKVDGNRVTVGITAFAVEQLGDITLVNLDVKVGDDLAAGKSFGTIESVKTLSDLYAPISGKIVEVNKELDAKPELVNEDCYGKAWMVVFEAADPSALAQLLDETAYTDHVKASAH
jgi:glycine cleavage system H protein